MGIVVMPAGKLNVGAPCEDATCGNTLPGQTAKKPRQRFADLPALAKVREKPESDPASGKTPDGSESVAGMVSRPQRKRTSSAGAEDNPAETPVAQPGLLPAAPAQVFGKHPAEGTSATVTPGESALPQVVNAGAETGSLQASKLQNLPAGMPSPSPAGLSEVPGLLPGETITAGDMNPLDSETANQVAQVVSGPPEPSGNAGRTDKSASQALPDNGADSGQATHFKNPNGEIPAVFVKRTPDQAAAVGPKAANPDPSPAAFAPVKDHVPVPDQSVGPEVKETVAASQLPAARAVKMPERTGEESRPGAPQGTTQQPQTGLFLEKKGPASPSAKDPSSAVSQGELRARSEFLIPAGESASPASQPATPDPTILDTPNSRSPVQNVGEQILDSVHASVVRGDKQLLVRLQPPELGTILVRFHEQGGAIQAVMEVHRNDTRREIEQALPQVLRGLQEMGVQIRRLDVVPHEQPEPDAGRGLFQQEGATSQQQNQGHHSGQTHDRFQPSWGTYRDSGRQNASDVPQGEAVGNSQERMGQGRIDVLL